MYTMFFQNSDKRRVDTRARVRGGDARIDTRARVRGGDGRTDTRARVRGGDGRTDTRARVRGGDGRPDLVDTRPLVRGGDGRTDTRPLVRGGDGRIDTRLKESESQDKEHCELRSFWWQYAGDCALLASVCASHEAACHSFWTHEEWMYNLLLHTSDEHFLKLASEYQKKCKQGVEEGICGVCGVTGLGGKLKLSLKSLRYLILRGDQYDDSKYGKFMRDLRVATNAKNVKDIAIVKLRLETLHTYTHPDGTVYHLFENGIIDDEYCRVCSTCDTSVSVFVESNENNRHNITDIYETHTTSSIHHHHHIQHSVES